MIRELTRVSFQTVQSCRDSQNDMCLLQTFTDAAAAAATVDAEIDAGRTVLACAYLLSHET